MNLRCELIYPQLMEAISKGVPGVTVSFLQKADNYESSQEDIRGELMIMRAASLVQSRQGGRWGLTSLGEQEAKKVVIPPGNNTAEKEPPAEVDTSATHEQEQATAQHDDALAQALDSMNGLAVTLRSVNTRTTPETRRAIEHLGQILDPTITNELAKLLADAEQLAQIKQYALGVFSPQ